jgi:glycerophosphoryl diester phosphodiesterase
VTKIVGHRGARNQWPENSMEGFRKTLELAVDAIEFDVHLTDAGEVVVIHDAMLDRTVEGTGKVRALSPDKRRTACLKGSHEPIPTLDEALSLFASSRPVELHVELKADVDGIPYEGLEALVASALRRHGIAKRSLLTSFNLEVLARCRRVAPDIGRLCSVNARSAEPLGVAATVARAAELADLLAVEKTLLAASSSDIEALVSRERLCCWVLNEREELEHWLGAGVGWITSDDPSLALAVRTRSRDAAA